MPKEPRTGLGPILCGMLPQHSTVETFVFSFLIPSALQTSDGTIRWDNQMGQNLGRKAGTQVL